MSYLNYQYAIDQQVPIIHTETPPVDSFMCRCGGSHPLTEAAVHFRGYPYSQKCWNEQVAAILDSLMDSAGLDT